MRHNYLTFILISTLSTGCMFHGNTPLSEGPAHFSTKNESAEKNLSEFSWWEDIGSEELNTLVNEGLEQNKKIALASKAIEGAQSSLDTIKLGWLPIFSFLGGRVQGNTAVNLPNLPLPLSSTGGFAAFLPMWVANIVQLPNQIKEAKKNIEATAADYLSLRTVICAQIVSSYTVLLASIEEEKILNDLKHNLQTRLQTQTQMAKHGLSTEISVTELQTELNKLEIQFKTNHSNQIAAKNALMLLVGKQIEDFTPKATLQELKIEHLAPGNTPTSVLAVRPDVVAARAKIEAADYGLSSSISSFAPIPTFTTANARMTSSNNGVDSTATANMQAGVALWILDPKFIGMINSKNKMYDAATIKYLDVVDTAVKEVDDNLADFTATQKKLNLEETNLNITKKNLKAYYAMYKNGLMSNTQYLETLSRYELAKAAIIQSKVQTVISLSKLYQSMGGGATYREKNYTLKNQTVVEREE